MKKIIDTIFFAITIIAVVHFFNKYLLLNKPTENYVSNVKMFPPSPSKLAGNQRVEVHFDYSIAQNGGAQIFVMPYSGSQFNANFLFKSSPVYRIGTGKASGHFGLVPGRSSSDRIDSVRIYMTDPKQTSTLYEVFIPVDYKFF